MKKRLALLWAPLVLGLAMALPASTVATTGYTFIKVGQGCFGSQGQNVYIEVKVTAAGSTSANKLTINSKSQYYSAGKWHNSYTWNQYVKTFSPNGNPHSADGYYEHTGTNQYNWRIVSKLRAWHGTQLLASKTIKSLAC